MTVRERRGAADSARRLVETLGGRDSVEVGIDIGTRTAVEEWFCAATLFGMRIGAAIAVCTYRTLAASGVRTTRRARPSCVLTARRGRIRPSRLPPRRDCRSSPPRCASDSAAGCRHWADALLGALDGAGTPGGIAFDDPDAVVDVEIIDNAGGVSLWTRDDRGAFPFVRVD